MLNNTNTSLRPRRYDWRQDYKSPIGIDYPELHPEGNTTLRPRDLRPPDRQSALMDETVPTPTLAERYLNDTPDESRVLRPRVVPASDAAPEAQPEVDPSRLLRDRSVQGEPINNPNPMGADERAGNKIDQREGRIEVLQDHPSDRPTKWWERMGIGAIQGLQGLSEMMNATRDPRTGQSTLSPAQALTIVGGNAVAATASPKGVARILNTRELNTLKGREAEDAAKSDRLLKQTRERAELEKTIAETGEIQGRAPAAARKQQDEAAKREQDLLEKDLSRIDHYTQGEDPDFDARLAAANMKPHNFDGRKGEHARVEIGGALYEKEGKQWRNDSTGELTDTLPIDRSKVLGEDNLTPSQRASNAAIAGREATQDARTQAEIDQNNQVIDSQLADLRDEKGRLEKAAGYLDLGLTQEQRAAREKERKSQLQTVTNQIRTLERQKKASLVPRVSAGSSGQKMASEADIQAYMKEHKVSREQAIKDAQADGYVIR